MVCSRDRNWEVSISGRRVDHFYYPTRFIVPRNATNFGLVYRSNGYGKVDGTLGTEYRGGSSTSLFRSGMQGGVEHCRRLEHKVRSQHTLPSAALDFMNDSRTLEILQE
jgi:hypothetical protein